MSVSFVRVLRSLLVFLFCGLLLAAVWITADVVYARFVSVTPEEPEKRERGNVLIALNAKLEEILEEQAETAEEERRRLEERLKSRELDSEEQEEVRRRLEEMLERQRELNQQIQETKAEEAGFSVETTAAREGTSATEEALVGLREQNVELQRTVEKLRERENSLRSEIEELTSEKRRIEEEKENLEQEIEARERRIANLERSLNAREGELSQREGEIADLREQYREEQERVSELREEMQSQSRRIGELRDELEQRQSELESVFSSRESLFIAAGINGVFHRIEGDLRMTVNPRRREEVLDQGTFDVHPPGEPGELKTRVLVESENGSLDYKRYPGQPEPEEGDWF